VKDERRKVRKESSILLMILMFTIDIRPHVSQNDVCMGGF